MLGSILGFNNGFIIGFQYLIQYLGSILCSILGSISVTAELLLTLSLYGGGVGRVGWFAKSFLFLTQLNVRLS